MLRRFAPLLLLAFIVGTLFRLGNQYDIPVLRMFATQGIVVIGFWGARILQRLQTEDGLRRVEEGLDKLPAGVSVRRVADARMMPVWILETSRGKILLGGSDVAHSARGRKAERVLARQAQEMAQAAYEKGVVDSDESLKPALILLRKGVSDDTKAINVRSLKQPVELINLEGLHVLLGSVG